MYRPTDLDSFLYLRKSRKDIEEEKKAIEEGRPFDTLERHRRQLLELAKTERHNIIDIFEEVASGEYISERPMMQELLRQVETGIADAVLVMDLDRLGRGDMLDQGIIDRAFRYSGTMIITPTEVYDPESETWELIFGIKSLVAREELKTINKRLQRGRRTSAKEGKSISKKPPYGYLRDENLKLYPDPDTAWVVKKIFEMMAAGMGRQAVAQELDRLGVKPPGGGSHWPPSSVSFIVKNEVYLGHIIWGQKRYVKINGKYQKRKVPREQWFRHDHAHEPLVSEELFKQANVAHSGRWRAPTVETKSLSNPLAGILRCELCDHVMVMTPRKDRPNDQIRCMQPSCKGKQKGINFSLVEERILQGLAQIVESFEVNDSMIERKENNSVIPIKRKALDKKQKELEDLHKQKNNLHDLLEKGVYDIATFMERQKVIAERIKETQEVIDQLQEELKQEEERERHRSEFVPRIKSVLEAYRQTDDVEKKNRLLKSVLEKATYRREKDWNKKDQFVIQLYPRI